MTILAQRLIARFHERFDEFEQILLSTHQSDPHFLNYVAEYRGVSVVRQQANEQALVVAERVFAHFKSVCSEVFRTLNGLSIDDVEGELKLFEQRVNLALIYWYGVEDKNFQFRTLAHYYDWEGLSGALFRYGNTEYNLTFFTDGFRIAESDSTRMPSCDGLLVACGPDPTTEKQYFARLRTVQNQLIFLVDLWEYRNTILAVEQGDARDLAKRNNNDEFYKEALQQIEKSRNDLASYVANCFADFEEWLGHSRALATRPETRDEWDATHALLLSGFQKLFLPGSISRHRFSKEVATACDRWIAARCQNVPHDFSARLAALVFALVLHGTADATPLFQQLCGRQSLDWSLSFDACTAIKAFSWSYATSNQQIFTMLLLVAVHKKLQPDPLDAFWLEHFAAAIQMPVTFPPPAPLPVGSLNLSEGDLSQLRNMTRAALNAVPRDDEITSLIEFLTKELELGTP